MTTSLYHKSRIWKAIAMFLLVLWLASSSRVTTTSASQLQDAPSPADIIRQDMHNIAYLYANHAWSASHFPKMPLFRGDFEKSSRPRPICPRETWPDNQNQRLLPQFSPLPPSFCKVPTVESDFHHTLLSAFSGN